MKYFIVLFSIVFCSTSKACPQFYTELCMYMGAAQGFNSIDAQLSRTPAEIASVTSSVNSLTKQVVSDTAKLDAEIRSDVIDLVDSINNISRSHELGLAKLDKLYENRLDYIKSAYLQLTKDALTAYISSLTDDESHPFFSQSQSSEIFANRASRLRKAMVLGSRVSESAIARSASWIDGENNISSASSSLLSKSLYSDGGVDNWNPSELFLYTTLDKPSSKESMHSSLTWLASGMPVNISESKESVNFSVEVLASKLEMLKRKLIYSSILHKYLNKSPTLSIEQWDQAYVISGKGSNFNDSERIVSNESLIDTELKGRALSDGWYLRTKTQYRSGLSRELVYMALGSGYSRMSANRTSGDELKMLALQLLSKTKKGLN